MQHFSKTFRELNLELPAARTEGVCILSWGQDHWDTAYMTDLLARRVGLNLSYACCDQPIPDSQLYFLPSVHMDNMSKHSHDVLKQKVSDGATIYISTRDGIFTEFTELTGLHVVTAEKSGFSGCFAWNGRKLLCQKTISSIWKRSGQRFWQKTTGEKSSLRWRNTAKARCTF